MNLSATLVKTLFAVFVLATPCFVASSIVEGTGGYEKAVHKQASIEIVNGMIEECDNAAICVLKRFADYVANAREEQAFETAIREKLAIQLEKYSCTDNTVSSSDPIRRTSWREWDVNAMHERPASKIHLIENFIGKDECQAILDVAEKDVLDRATFAGGQNNFKIRKVLQTDVLQTDEEQEGHLIAGVRSRVFDYANHILEGLNLREHGQANLKYLRYSGRGRNDTLPDHYAAHCDGTCEGAQHERGGRVATMVMYCETAEDGGHTHFRNAGVHVAAKPGDAVFFSYVDPSTLMMDNGFSAHSGCPVYEGNKKIITQWIRLGVDEEHPYNSFNVF